MWRQSYSEERHFDSCSLFMEVSILFQKFIKLNLKKCSSSEEQRFFRADEVIVALGSIDRFDYENSYRFDVTHYTKMKTFDISSYKDDVAILFLNEYAPNDAPTVKIIPLETGKIEADTICRVTSFGAQNFLLRYLLSPVLMIGNVTVNDDNLCNSAFENEFQDGKICSLNIDGKKVSWEGDSGGPLLCNGKLAGVISGGNAGLYANVSYYLPWIQKSLQENPEIPKPIDTSFQVSIRNRYLEEQNTYGQGHVCSGTLLGDTVVLTAASCVYK